MAKIYVHANDEKVLSGLIGTVATSGQECIAIALDVEQAKAALELGASGVLVLQGQSERIEDYASAMAKLMADEGASALLVQASGPSQDFAALVAGYAGFGMASDVTSIAWVTDCFETTRTLYGGAVEITETVATPQVISYSPKAQAMQASPNPDGEIRELQVEAPAKVTVISSEPIERSGADISDAERIVCVGLGFAKEEDLDLARNVASVLDAQIACTRPIASDREWLPTETYIGISGKVVAPELYLGLGVSGQVQHTYGIRDSKVIAVVNSNKDATFFNEADYGLVGDLYEVAPVLAAAIEKARA